MAHRVRWQETSGTTARVAGATGPGGGDQQAKLSPCAASHWPSLPLPRGTRRPAHPLPFPSWLRLGLPCLESGMPGFLLLRVSGAVVTAAGGPPCTPHLQGRLTPSPLLHVHFLGSPHLAPKFFFLGTGLWPGPRLEWTLGVRLGCRCASAPGTVLTRGRSPEALGWLSE